MNKDVKRPSHVQGRMGGPRMGGGPGMGGHGMVGEKAKDFKGSMKKLLAYLGKYKIRIFIVLLFAVASTVFTIIGPKILGNVTTELFNGIMRKISGSEQGINFTYIAQIMWWLLGLYVVSALFSYLQGFIMTGVSMRVTYGLRNDIIKKINRMPLGYFDTTSHGEVLSRVTNDIDTLSQTLNQSVTQIITSVTSILGILIMMLTISWQLTLVALCIVPVSLIFVVLIVKRSQKYFAAQQEYLGHVNGHVEEMYGGHVVMDDVPRKIFSRVEELKAYRLDVPQVTLLAYELKKAGIPLPDGILTTKELVDALCH